MSARMSLGAARSEEHTSELQSHSHLVCRLLLEKKKYASGNAIIRMAVYLTCAVQVSHQCLPLLCLSPSAYSAHFCIPTLVLLFFFFFLKNGAPPEFHSFPSPGAFRF